MAMTRQQAVDYMTDRFYVEEMSDAQFTETLKLLMETPHKPWCRTRLRHSFPNYGSDCTCDEKGAPIVD